MLPTSVSAPPSAAPSSITPVEVIPYRHETPLFWITAVYAVLVWIMLVIFSFGLAIPIVLLLGLLSLMAQSILISWLKGNTVHITPQQFPDLHALYQQSCDRLGLDKQPELYLVQADGMLNALATRFMRRDYVVLLSGVVDALKERPEAIKFYMGHELGHVKRKHLSRHWWLWTGLLIPLLTPAYSRAREYTCDRYGMACCNSLDDAKRAMAVLVAGEDRWKTLNLQGFEQQAQASGGFWMAVNELTSDYPWLSKRMVRLENRDAEFPRRSFFAWMIAAVSPPVGIGSAAIGFLFWLMMGAIALVMVLLLSAGPQMERATEWLQNSPMGKIMAPEPKPDEELDTEKLSALIEEFKMPQESTDAVAEAMGHMHESIDAALADTHPRMVKISAALDAYAKTHKGKYPETLDALKLDEDLTSGISYVIEDTPYLGASLYCKECEDTGLFMEKPDSSDWECTGHSIPDSKFSELGINCQAYAD